MFRVFGRGKTPVNVVHVVADGSVSQRRPVPIPEAPAAANKGEKTPWWSRLFHRPTEKDMPPLQEKQSDQPTRSKQKARKCGWWRWCRRRNRVAPAPEEQSCSTTHQDRVEDGVSTSKTMRQQQVQFLGFPNSGQICYMNCCLQSLLTLQDFVRDISCQEQVWSLSPEAAIMRSFMNIKKSHFSRDAGHKSRLLATFKDVVSVWNPDFADQAQKSAHDFLTSVLEKMRSELQLMATCMDGAYSCPVDRHLMFKMRDTRTCKRCGAGSSRDEEFIDLSLDLVPGGGTVDQMLQNHLEEAELQFICECGATTSGQRSSFVDLPRVLVLRLNRFVFTSPSHLQKIHDPVVLSRELVVSSNQGGACYSLVSIISHFGYLARRGHYISDGVDPDVGQEDPADRWFTYNDAKVTETTGASVCNHRQRTAHILFYKRQD